MIFNKDPWAMGDVLKMRVLLLWQALQPRLLAMFVAFDCLALSLLKTGDHYRGATISAVCWELEQQGTWRGRIFRPLIDWLLRRLEPEHCARAWLTEHYLRKGPTP